MKVDQTFTTLKVPVEWGPMGMSRLRRSPEGSASSRPSVRSRTTPSFGAGESRWMTMGKRSRAECHLGSVSGFLDLCHKLWDAGRASAGPGADQKEQPSASSGPASGVPDDDEYEEVEWKPMHLQEIE